MLYDAEAMLNDAIASAADDTCPAAAMLEAAAK